MFHEPWKDREAWERQGLVIDMADASREGGYRGLCEKVFDVVVVGSGAGGGICSAYLANAGFSVLILESGGLFTAKDFNGSEALYTSLYKNGLLDATQDGAINLLQGHCVGGSATVNWTSSFRLPDQTISYWQDTYKVFIDRSELANAYDVIEQQLGVLPWSAAPNLT